MSWRNQSMFTIRAASHISTTNVGAGSAGSNSLTGVVTPRRRSDQAEYAPKQADATRHASHAVLPPRRLNTRRQGDRSRALCSATVVGWCVCLLIAAAVYEDREFAAWVRLLEVFAQLCQGAA